MRLSFLLAIIACLSYACLRAPDYPNTPFISYQGVNKTTVYQNGVANPLDTLTIFFSFTDGDGDLSSADSIDIFLLDSRFPSLQTPYKFPLIPTEGTENGIKGEVSIRIPNSIPGSICCIDNGFACPPISSIAVDTFSYEIQIRDRAGNFSNKIRTEELTVLCR